MIKKKRYKKLQTIKTNDMEKIFIYIFYLNLSNA